MSNICSRTTLKSNDLSSLQKELNFIRRKVCEALTSGGGGSLPDQSGHSGEFLTTDGTSASWATAGGGTDSPDRINGTATANVNADLASNTIKFFYDHLDSHTGYLQFSSGDEGFKTSVTDGTITMRTEMSFDSGFLQRYTDGSGTYEVNMNSTGLNYTSDISANFIDRSLIDRGYLGQLGVGLVPATTDNIFLGSTSKMWKGLFLADLRTIDWNNGKGKLWYDNAGGIMRFEGDGQGGDNYFQFYKTGRTSYIQVINGTVSDGVMLMSSFAGTPAIKTLANGPLVMLPNGAEKLFLGVITVGTGKLSIGPSTTTVAQLNLEVGSAPTSPSDGDVWRQDNTNTGLKIRVNGVTKTVTLS